MTPYNKPVPVEDPDSAPFWAGCREQKLLVQHCLECRTPRYPARPYCHQCQSTHYEWRASSGRGSVYSWIVVHHPVPKEIYAGDVPYVVALIDLEEGVRMASNIIGCDPDAISGGMPVEVQFEQVTTAVTLPQFRPSTAA